jgi:hypothetical protein
MQAVWPNTFFEEANIGQNIFVVRGIHRNSFYWAGFVLTGDPGESANSSLVASAR